MIQDESPSKRVKVSAEPTDEGNLEPCSEFVLRDEIDIVEDLPSPDLLFSPVKKSVRVKKPSPKKAETMELEKNVKSSKKNAENKKSTSPKKAETIDLEENVQSIKKNSALKSSRKKSLK